MQGNEEIVGRFSRFLNLRERQGRMVLDWQADPQLERHMRQLVADDGNAIAEYWARYFLKILRGELEPDRTEAKHKARRHLMAYLQPVCNRVAQKLSHRHRQIEILRRRYSYSDYFQFASEAASDPAKLFKNFSLTLPSTVSAYAFAALDGKARDTILQKNKEIAWRTDGDWGLLKNVSQKRLEAALTARGMQPELERDLSIWHLFKEIYVPTVVDGKRQLAAPTPEALQQIAKYYNQHRFERSQPGAAIAANTVFERLEQMVQAVRDRNKIRLSYPDRTGNPSDAEASGDVWDLVTSERSEPSSNDPLTVLVNRDEQNAIAAALTTINTALCQAFSALPDRGQILLRLWKPGLGLTQAEIGRVCDRKQYAISRQLTRYRQDLLQAFVQRVETDFNLTLDSDRLVMLKALMTDRLGPHCQRFFHDGLSVLLQTLPLETRTALTRYAQIVQTQSSSTAVTPTTATLTTATLTAAKQQLQTAFAHKLETIFNPPVRSLNAVTEPIATFIEHWLCTVATLNDKETSA